MPSVTTPASSATPYPDMPARTSIPPRRIRQVTTTLERMFGRPERTSPRPDPVSMLIATILSQNTSDRNSHRAWISLRERFPSWKRLEDAPLRSIRSAIRIGGMAQQKAARIRTAIRLINDGYGGVALRAIRRLNDDRAIERLTEIPGVGVKTAACVLLFSMDRGVFPVDTHVHRVCTRLGLAPGSRSPEETFRIMRGRVPAADAHALHTNMIRFGRSVCRAQRPLCGSCHFMNICTHPGRHDRREAIALTPHESDSFTLLDSIRPA